MEYNNIILHKLILLEVLRTIKYSGIREKKHKNHNPGIENDIAVRIPENIGSIIFNFLNKISPHLKILYPKSWV